MINGEEIPRKSNMTRLVVVTMQRRGKTKRLVEEEMSIREVAAVVHPPSPLRSLGRRLVSPCCELLVRPRGSKGMPQK